MAGGHSGSRELDRTPTWAVALVCAVIVMISIALEKVLHSVAHWFQKRNKNHMLEALEKIKGELMVLGFISLILTFGQNYISRICIPIKIADTMLPCKLHHDDQSHDHGQGHGHEPPAADHGRGRGPGPGHEAEHEHHRRLLWNEHRILAADSPAPMCKNGYVPLISIHGLHQLHIFIFFLAIFHVIYSAITMMLGRMKIRRWKEWERENSEHITEINDPTRFRLTHETSFVRDHTNFWTTTPFLFYIVCFFRQFFRSVSRSDYLAMRHGFVSVHLAPGSKFDFQKYIKRSLEDDFKVVVGISPLLWTFAILFLLLNVDGLQAMFWLSLLPLIVILSVGTKLQAIITEMAVEIQERHAVVQGIPLVQVSDRHFWFSWPQLILYLIHLTLFQNAFELTYVLWIWYEFGMKSCFHDSLVLMASRVATGIGVQILCSYITLPLYALVTQMGSTMKRSIFDDQTSKALKNWKKHAMKKKQEGKTGMPTQTLGGTPPESLENSPRQSDAHADQLGDGSYPKQVAQVDILTDLG
ncbi:MLO-like protein 9 [Diospyros lotus]|uniref:MLO-like protein 9 n=1 Tax=Diospyros lotus TaxID=55363 RepID=UPI00225BE94C|nr:MLO-like protein 9 [Diospyros lotus]